MVITAVPVAATPSSEAKPWMITRLSAMISTASITTSVPTKGSGAGGALMKATLLNCTSPSLEIAETSTVSLATSTLSRLAGVMGRLTMSKPGTGRISTVARPISIRVPSALTNSAITKAPTSVVMPSACVRSPSTIHRSP